MRFGSRVSLRIIVVVAAIVCRVSAVVETVSATFRRFGCYVTSALGLLLGAVF